MIRMTDDLDGARHALGRLMSTGASVSELESFLSRQPFVISHALPMRMTYRTFEFVDSGSSAGVTFHFHPTSPVASLPLGLVELRSTSAEAADFVRPV